MIFYYLMRDVDRGADCSYQPGRTYIDEVFRTADEADRRADQCNRHTHVDGVRYCVVTQDDRQPIQMDYYEPAKVRHERVMVG